MEFEKDRCYFKDQHVRHYAVRTTTYRSEDMTLEEIDKKVSAMDTIACYGVFWRKLEKDHTHFYTILAQDRTMKVVLTEKEVMEWIDLCKKYDLLPKTVKNEECYYKDEEGNVWFKLRLFIYNRPQARTYLHIDSFRHLREDPGFIKSILYLHLECDVNFYVAYVMSSHLNITGTGHHAILISNTAYSSVNKPNVVHNVLDTKNPKMNLKVSRSLYKFVHQKKLFNDKDRKICKTASSWNCNSKISDITSRDLVVPLKYLSNKRVDAIVSEVDCAKAEKLWTKFIEEIEEAKKNAIISPVEEIGIPSIKAKYDAEVDAAAIGSIKNLHVENIEIPKKKRKIKTKPVSRAEAKKMEAVRAEAKKIKTKYLKKVKQTLGKEFWHMLK